MTISKQCELLAGDYLFLRDKLMGLQDEMWQKVVTCECQKR